MTTRPNLTMEEPALLSDRATVIKNQIERAAFPEESFDLVTPRMALHYIADLEAAARRRS